MSRKAPLLVPAALALLAAAFPASAQQPKPALRPVAEVAEFFEKHVRPVLFDSCVSCHGAKKEMAGLRLDNPAGMNKGSDNGPVIVAGDPGKSRLIQAIKHEGGLKMPPKSKLSPESVQAVSRWIEMGAHWPQTGDYKSIKSPASAESIAGLRRTHWSFRPVENPAPPAVKNAAWPASPIDNFILAPLETKGMRPAAPADKRTLIRRATLDLHGVPPTPEEVAAFEADNSPDAFAKVLDRLLASPLYGQRWGRHWLDIARYSDTKGYVFLEERKYAYSYTYRDYVIRAFNEDLPYDRFIVEQLAADKLDLSEDKRPLAAMGFLTLGRRFLNNTPDIIDDRLDVVSRGLIGLTVSCARCHDHKFDPIPTADYYSLYGVFAASNEPKDLPLIGKPLENEESRKFEKDLKGLEDNVEKFLRPKYNDAISRYRSQVGDYLLAAYNAERAMDKDEVYVANAAGELNPRMTPRWLAYVVETRKRFHPVWGPWNAFTALKKNEFAAKAKDLSARFAAVGAAANDRVNPLIAAAFAGEPPKDLREVATRYDKVFDEVERLRQAARAAGAAETAALPDRPAEELRRVLDAANSPTALPITEVDRFLDRAARDQLTGLRKKVESFKANSPAAPPRAMVLADNANPAATQRIFNRGNPNNLGEAVPRRFLAVLSPADRKPFAGGSGRLELAKSIAGKDNPLTARVLVNRVWQHHFAAGLVRTPGDFGLRSDPPTHPQLLDHLARRFMDAGWSIKKLHKMIMLSATYRQGSTPASADYARADPDNNLVWMVNRRRLDFESMRDSLLWAGGRLDTRLEGGPSKEMFTRPFMTRRTIYGFIERQNLPGTLRTFDFASPDTTTPQRHVTTVPQQALFLMNSPFVIEQAKAMIARPEIAAATDPAERIRRLHRLLYGRAPDADEAALGLKFVQSAPEKPAAGTKLTAWEQYGQVLLLANEFVFVD